MEKQNKAARQRRKKEEMARIRTLVGTTSSMAVVCPRVQVGVPVKWWGPRVQVGVPVKW